jgi:hypothetical protein
VLRGGSWINEGRNCRSAYRNHNQPDIDIGNDNNGFRLARSSTRRWNGRERPDLHLVRAVLLPGEKQGRRMR